MADDPKRYKKHSLAFSIAQQRGALERARKAGADQLEIKRIQAHIRWLENRLADMKRKR
jgi:uncharacterized coiled-coil protein SlyX